MYNTRVLGVELTRTHNIPHRGEYLGQTTLQDRTVQDLIDFTELYRTLQDFIGLYRT